MDTSKIIKGIVNARGYTVTKAITQWDYGYVFVPEFDDLPATYRLDFSNDEHHGTALPVYCGSEGGEVPEELIETGKDIFVWFFYIGDGFGKSEYKWRIPNKCKPKTEEDEPSPSQQSSIDQAISVVNDAVERAEDAQQAIEDMSVSATTLAEGSTATVTKTEQDGVVHLAFGIPKGQTGAQGERGEKGDKGDTGATGAKGEQGERGLTGADGISPTVTITPITGGHRITITDADGEHSADVMDGQTPTVPVDDVQINGTSIVSDGVANVPMMTGSVYGVSKSANTTEIKSGLTTNRSVTASNAYVASFYGLAKSAGDTTQSQSSNAVGQYTDEAKSKIKKMIGANDEFELIRCITLEEDMAKVTIDADNSSSPFEITDFVIFIWSVGASGATSEAAVKVALNSTNLDANRCSEIGSLIRKEGVNTSRSGYVFGINAKKLCYFAFSSVTINRQIVDGSGNISEFGEANGMAKSHDFVGISTVNSVTVGTTSGGKFGTGSIIALYGIRA